MKSLVLRIAGSLAVIIALLGIPQLAGKVASLFSYPFDSAGAFAWIGVHHVVQALLFIPIAVLIGKFVPIDWKIGLGDRSKGIRYMLRFTKFFFIYTAFGFAYVFLTSTFSPFGYPLNGQSIFGQLGFQLFLSGPSEEWIFRGVGLGLLSFIWKARVFQGKLGVANLMVALVFALAHVGISFAPFELFYNPVQLVYAFVLGLVYGDCLERTGSVVYPMAIHSISNVIAVGTTILFTMILG